MQSMLSQKMRSQLPTWLALNGVEAGLSFLEGESDAYPQEILDWIKGKEERVGALDLVFLVGNMFNKFLFNASNSLAIPHTVLI